MSKPKLHCVLNSYPIGPYMTFICNIKTQFAHFSAKIKKNRVLSQFPPLNNNERVFGI